MDRSPGRMPCARELRVPPPESPEATRRIADLERRLAEANQALAEHQRLTERVINSIDVGLLALDAEGGYQMVNHQHEAHMRLSHPDGHPRIAGDQRYLYDADGVSPLRPEQAPSARAAAGEMFNDSLVWAGPDPTSRRAFAVSATPHHDAEGRFAGTVLAFKDVTDLLQALRIRDEFVANVSHELRTPLTSIIGYVDVLLEEAQLSDDVRRMLEPVQRNSRRLHRMVDDLLSTALGPAAATYETEPTCLSALVHSAATEAGQRAAEAGIRLEVDTTQGGDLWVDGDPQRLLQVFDNLLSNAIKYSETGGTVTVAMGRDSAQAVVRVIDDGRGIAADEVDFVFDRFFRSSSVQADAVQGVGLGLAITRTIVEAHDGTITVSSELGRGSTFEVRLPLCAPCAMERRPSDQQLPDDERRAAAPRASRAW